MQISNFPVVYVQSHFHIHLRIPSDYCSHSSRANYQLIRKESPHAWLKFELIILSVFIAAAALAYSYLQMREHESASENSRGRCADAENANSDATARDERTNKSLSSLVPHWLLYSKHMWCGHRMKTADHTFRQNTYSNNTQKYCSALVSPASTSNSWQERNFIICHESLWLLAGKVLSRSQVCSWDLNFNNI